MHSTTKYIFNVYLEKPLVSGSHNSFYYLKKKNSGPINLVVNLNLYFLVDNKEMDEKCSFKFTMQPLKNFYCQQLLIIAGEVS